MLLFSFSSKAQFPWQGAASTTKGITETVVFRNHPSSPSMTGNYATAGSALSAGNTFWWQSTKRFTGEGYIQYKLVLAGTNQVINASVIDQGGNDYNVEWTQATGVINFRLNGVSQGTVTNASLFSNFIRIYRNSSNTLSVRYATSEEGTYISIHSYTTTTSTGLNFAGAAGGTGNGVNNSKISGVTTVAF